MSKEITAAADSAANLSEQQKDTAQAAQALSEAATETAEAMQSLDQTGDSVQETLNTVDSAAASATDQVEQLGKAGEAADSGLKAVKNTPRDKKRAAQSKDHTARKFVIILLYDLFSLSKTNFSLSIIVAFATNRNDSKP